MADVETYGLFTVKHMYKVGCNAARAVTRNLDRELDKK